MTGTESPRSSPTPQAGSGRRAAIGSLLMLPAAVAMMVVGVVIGNALQVAFDLAEGDLLTDAGVGGWLVAFALIALMCIAPAVGVLLGRRAVRAGEHRRGRIGLAANAVVGAYVLLANLAALTIG